MPDCYNDKFFVRCQMNNFLSFLPKGLSFGFSGIFSVRKRVSVANKSLPRQILGLRFSKLYLKAALDIPIHVFLVGAFLKKRARLLQSLVFFYFFLFKTDSKRRTLKVKINVQLLKVLNYWTAKGKHGERIHSLFQRYIQARTGLKFRTPPPPRFDFFFGAVRFFFEFF